MDTVMVPKVGDGATIHMYSDRHAGTIVEVSKNGKRVVVQRDKATRLDKKGVSEQQDYLYTPDKDGIKRAFSLRKDGQWVECGSKKGSKLGIGYRREYYDYTF